MLFQLHSHLPRSHCQVCSPVHGVSQEEEEEDREGWRSGVKVILSGKSIFTKLVNIEAERELRDDLV